MASGESEPCPFCPSSIPSLRRAVKRGLGTTEEDHLALRPPTPSSSSSSECMLLAGLETDNECRALRETLTSQDQTIQGLQVELDKERNASSSAASEAMSMILRLQREKSEIAMEARQFKRYAEEKMSHDQQVIAVLEDGIYKRDHEIRILWHELQDCKERLLSCGGVLDFDLDELGIDDGGGAAGYNSDEYPQINCRCGGKLPWEEEKEEDECFEKDEILEKGVVVTNGSSNSPPTGNSGTKHHHHQQQQQEEFPVTVDWADDESCDRVYTVDAIHEVAAQEESVVDAGTEEADIKKLYMRLHALEADRESLKQELVSIQNNSSQDVQLKELWMEIAQNLSKGVTARPLPRLPEEEVNDAGSSNGRKWWCVFGFGKLPLKIRLGVPFLLKALVILVYRKQIVGFLCMKNLRK